MTLNSMLPPVEVAKSTSHSGRCTNVILPDNFTNYRVSNWGIRCTIRSRATEFTPGYHREFRKGHFANVDEDVVTRIKKMFLHVERMNKKKN